jgi:hypothetical protein
VAPTRCSNLLHSLLGEQEVEDLHQEEEASLVVEVVVEDHQEEALHLLELHTQV